MCTEATPNPRKGAALGGRIRWVDLPEAARMLYMTLCKAQQHRSIRIVAARVEDELLVPVVGRFIFPCIWCGAVWDLECRAFVPEDPRKEAVIYFLCRSCAGQVDEIGKKQGERAKEEFVARLVERVPDKRSGRDGGRMMIFPSLRGDEVDFS